MNQLQTATTTKKPAAGLNSSENDPSPADDRMLTDSRAARSACPPPSCSGTHAGTTSLRVANGATIKKYGERTVRLRCRGHGVDVNILEVP